MGFVLLTLSSLLVTGSRSLSLPSQTANAGSEVVLLCSLASQEGGDCHWVKDGWVLELAGRYRSSHCDLIISPVLPLDQGQYQCQVGGSRPLKSPPVVLSVNTEPSHPEIQQGDKRMVEAGETLELSCQAGGAKPPADIEWWNVETGQRIQAEVNQHVERTGGEGGTFQTTSILNLAPAQYTEVFCTAHSQAFPTNLKSLPVEISVRGKPRMESLELSQGESVKLLCQNDAVESSGKWKWFINENQISGEESNLLEITKFAKIYDNTVIKCARENADGEDEILRRVRLIYNPHKLLSVPAPVSARTSPVKTNKKETFLCVSTIEEATEPKYVWIKGNHGKHQQSQYNFVSKDKNYKCKVVRNGAKNMLDISRELNVMNRKLKKLSRHLEEMYS